MSTDLTELARASYRAYETGDRAAMEGLVAGEFAFWSPQDDGIDRAAYFERCWPASDQQNAFSFVRLLELGGGEVLVTYEAERKDGSRFRNTEIQTFADGQLVKVEVYFGWDL